MKLNALLRLKGYENLSALSEACAGARVVPGICTQLSCDFVRDMAPDQDRGWCPRCGTSSMKSAFVLAGLI